MKKIMRRVVAILALVAAIGGMPAFAGGDVKGQREEWPPEYKSPLVDLMFLPIKVLIRVGSVFKPSEEEGERSGTGEPSSRE